MSDIVERSNPQPEVEDELERIRRAVQGGTCDAEDLRSYATHVVSLRKQLAERDEALTEIGKDQFEPKEMHLIEVAHHYHNLWKWAQSIARRALGGE